MTDREKADILGDMVILCDNREKSNLHILEYFEENEIYYLQSKMETADYSYILPNYPCLDLNLSVLIERKNSLDELAGNFTKHRDRFKREFERVGEENIHLLVEGATWRKLLKGSYRSQFNPKSYMASILSYNLRYNCPVWFVGVEESPVLIYNILRYHLLEKLKGM